ncbi:MAG: XdhC family protein [Actinomycetota bacterium]|nr:XdhC family protein [Actinomycetota bacterium]
MASVLEAAAAAGRRTLIGRVIELKGFSTLPVDEMIVLDDEGRLHGDFLGRPGAERLGAAARGLFGGEPGLGTVGGEPGLGTVGGEPGLGTVGGEPGLGTVGISIHGPQVQELGLSCGGQANVLLQPTSAIPARFWVGLAERAPVALVTVIDGPAAGPHALAVDRDGQRWGALEAAAGPEVGDELAGTARALLREGRTASRRVETGVGVALVEAWVPTPRVVVVGGGDILAALEAQVALLGWEVRGADGREAVEAIDGLLDWAGATGALVVCSHDPHVDSPALAAGLGRTTPYIGAMGSRGTQSRRIERLKADGISDDQIERIHRPIGLNLGGRRASEVALAIVAEILACHCGRDARSLKDTSGPIHG